MEVLSLLQSENRCLEKLLSFSRQFLVCSQKREWSGLDDFDSKRQVFFKTLDLLDRKITEAAESLKNRSAILPLDVSESLQKELELRRDVIDRIIEVDAALIAELEKESKATSGDVASSRKNKDLVSKFKSSWLPQSGSEMDNQV